MGEFREGMRRAVWRHTKALHRIRGPQEGEAMQMALKKTVVFHGRGALDKKRTEQEAVASIIDFLLHQRKAPARSILQWKLFKSLLLKEEPGLLSRFRQGVQEALLEGMKTVENDELFQIFVYNLVGLFTFGYPEVGSLLSLPTKRGERWELTEYCVERRFQLSPEWLSSPLPSYGLTSPNAPPLLLFLGTTYPAGAGFAATLLSDATPGCSVGYAPAAYGKKQIAAWLENKRDAITVGISLGGSCALHAAQHHPGISEVHAFAPAGLYPWERKSTRAQIHIYSQWNDIVSRIGYFPGGENVKIYRLLLPRHEDPIKAHQRVYAAAKQVTILRSKTTFENTRWSRHLYTVFHLASSPISFALMLPFHLLNVLVRMLLRLCLHMKNE